jgi:DNA invertase Pin-like site-specific DNA recombinase
MLPRMGHLLGYARVSTTDQQPQLQVDALTAAGCYRVFTETASGARSDRRVRRLKPSSNAT